MEKVFASVRFSSPLSVAVARTSQSPFPLSAILYQKFGFLPENCNCDFNGKKFLRLSEKKYEFRCQTYKGIFAESYTFKANTRS